MTRIPRASDESSGWRRACAALLVAACAAAACGGGNARSLAPDALPLIIPPIAASGDAGTLAPAVVEADVTPGCIDPVVRARVSACPPPNAGVAHPSRDEVLAATLADQTQRSVRPSGRPPSSGGATIPPRPRPSRAAPTPRTGLSSAPGSSQGRTEEARARLSPRSLAASQENVAALHAAYICDHPDDVAMLYQAARQWFEAQHWDEAAVLFERVAFGPPGSDDAPYAAQLYLEALNVLGSHFSRRECFDEMAVTVPKARARLCAPAFFPRRAETCTTLEAIEADIQRLKAQSTVTP